MNEVGENLGGEWSFAGRSDWTQDPEGIIRNPTWRFRAGRPVLEYWPRETDDRQRLDSAFLRERVLGDFELSVSVMLFIQTTQGEIYFRSQDSRRGYVLVIRDVYEKNIYEITLWVQDAEGLRRRFAQTLCGSTDIWRTASQHPKWDELTIRAEGRRIRVLLNGLEVIDCENGAYACGVAGIGSLGRIAFKDFRIQGSPARLDKPWSLVPGESPPFVYPFPSDREDLAKPTRVTMLWPTGVVLDDGEIVLTRAIVADEDQYGAGTMIVRSTDDGRTWSEETRVDGMCLHHPFLHADGRLGALLHVPYGPDGKPLRRRIDYEALDRGATMVTNRVLESMSPDRGRTWGEPRPLCVGSTDLSSFGQFWLYSGFRRLSDGSLLWTPYGGKTEYTRAEERTNQTFSLRSEDDGQTWSVPVPVEETNCDTNEGSVAQLACGDLLLFMRSVRSPFMWKARSRDKGRTWLPLEKTDITMDCPQFIRHSSGTLVMQSRGGMVITSADDGVTWSPIVNIGYTVHMGCLLEAKDGALLVAHHDAGFADITKVRLSRFRLSDGGLRCDG